MECPSPRITINAYPSLWASLSESSAMPSTNLHTHDNQTTRAPTSNPTCHPTYLHSHTAPHNSIFPLPQTSEKCLYHSPSNSLNTRPSLPSNAAPNASPARSLRRHTTRAPLSLKAPQSTHAAAYAPTCLPRDEQKRLEESQTSKKTTRTKSKAEPSSRGVGVGVTPAPSSASPQAWL